MKRIVFSKQCDADADLLPLWYWWYTNIFKVDQIIILGAAVKDVTSTQKVKAFWVNKDVIYKEKVYNEWFAPRVWLDQKTIVGPLLPKTNYLALSADMDEFFEPPEQKHIKGQNRIAYVQKRLWTPEPITLENVMTIPIYGIHARQNLLTATASKRGAFLNNFDNPNIRMPGLIHGTPPSGLYFFHFHFRGLEWFKNKFSKMSYATKGPGASTHWKRYTQLLKEQADTIENRYKSLVNRTKRFSEDHTETVHKFRSYFD